MRESVAYNGVSSSSLTLLYLCRWNQSRSRSLTVVLYCPEENEHEDTCVKLWTRGFHVEFVDAFESGGKVRLSLTPRVESPV